MGIGIGAEDIKRKIVENGIIVGVQGKEWSADGRRLIEKLITVLLNGNAERRFWFWEHTHFAHTSFKGGFTYIHTSSLYHDLSNISGGIVAFLVLVCFNFFLV